MKETGVFWLGKRARSGEQNRHIADQPEFVDAMQSACRSLGCSVQRFISATGPYGTWIIEFGRDGQNQRIVWNGKDEKMVLQVALPGGGWEEPCETTIESCDTTGFADGINRLIGRCGGSE